MAEIIAIRPDQQVDPKFLKPGSDLNVMQRAREALAEFYRIQPQLTALVRMMTKDNTIGVLPTGGAPRTDGRNVYIHPNLGLADKRRHPDPRICYTERQSDGLLTCEACREREEIMVSLFHEIGHNVFDSFEAMDDVEKARAVNRAVEEAERAGISPKKIERLKRSFEKQPPANYVEAAARISPFMPMLLNALEDARVNRNVIETRPGMGQMFAASDARIFREGNENQQGQRFYWSDAPANAQVIIGTFIVASGIELVPGWLSDEVADVLADPDLRGMLDEVRDAPDVKTVYKVAFPILERIRELGYCRLDEEQEEDEPQPQEGVPNKNAEPDEQDTGGDDDSIGDAGGDGPSQSDPWSDDEDDDLHEQEEADESTSGDEGSADTEADDEGEEGDAGSAGMSAESNGDEEGGEDTEPGESDEDGNGGNWNSRERDDLGEDPLEMGSDGDLGDDEVDEDEADGTAKAGGDPDPEEADDDDEEAASGADEGAGDEDPTPDGDDGTGDPHASGEGDDADDQPRQDNASPGDGKSAESYCQQGTPEEVQELLAEFGGHSNDDEPIDPQEEDAIDRAIEQDKHFDAPSDIVHGVRVHDYDNPTLSEGGYREDYAFQQNKAQIEPVQVDERNIQMALVPMRKAFTANKSGKTARNLRSGGVDGRSLGKRVPAEDDRMFKKRKRPAKRDYHVVIGLDISGSTASCGRLDRIKAAAYMQAELCNRVGVPFEMWAHTGVLLKNKPLDEQTMQANNLCYPYQISLEMYKIKDLNEPWTDRTRERLSAVRPFEVNLDGHTMEFYRKRLDSTRTTDKLLIYYTDGAMPNFNYDEELAVLQRELGEFRKRGYSILGVGIDTDSPRQHGLDTVAVYDDADVRKVVMELEKRLA